MKRIISVFLAMLMVVTILPLSAFAETDITSYLLYEINNGEVTITDCNTSISGDVVIPETIEGYPVRSIASEAFRDCDYLESVIIGNSVTSVGNKAFAWCDSIENITIPDSVTSVGNKAFYFCNSLTSIIVDENNTYYSSDKYGVLFNKEKTELMQYPAGNKRTSYVVPDSVTSIGDSAFYYCDSLTSVTIGDSVTSIGDSAFSYCKSLTSITIPDSVTSIGDFAFSDCGNLTSITIPDSVTSIGDYAFRYCYDLTSVTIGDSVTSIGEDAFYVCYSLTSITIPDSVTSIGDYAFRYCYDLTSVTIGDSVTSIADYAFCDCDSLTSITIPDSVTSIGLLAFGSCDSLKDVYYSGTEEQWKKISIDAFNESLTNATIHFNSGGNSGGNSNVVDEHNYSATVTSPTCTEKGYTIYTCSCGDTYIDNYVDATGHTPGKWSVVTAAQVGKKGLEQKKCTECGKVLDERSIPALPDDTFTPGDVNGDVNGDGKITAADARIVLRISAKLDSMENYNLPLEAFDVTGDGKLNAADARKILRISAKLE